MEKYQLILSARTKEGKREELALMNLATPRVPVKDEILNISDGTMQDYFKKLQGKDHFNYLKLFGNARYHVTDVEHNLISSKKGLETVIVVNAFKI